MGYNFAVVHLNFCFACAYRMKQNDQSKTETAERIQEVSIFLSALAAYSIYISAILIFSYWLPVIMLTLSSAFMLF